MTRIHQRLFAVAGFVLALTAAAPAQDYPTKPVRIIVPFAPGGLNDVVGRMIATQAKTGERLWSLNVPSTQTPWVAGDSVFVVDTTGQLLAVSRKEGKVLWTVKLPGGPTWSGPTLAGNTLWLASSTGSLVGVDAVTGRVTGQQDLGTAVYVAPVVAQSKMFVLTDSAKLIALN